MDKSISITITGQVQGVGYRYFALRLARSLRIGGWVRNRPDGRVEVLAEGDEEALRTLVEGLREGPLGAEVEKLVVDDVPVEGFAGFEVRR